MKQDIIKQIGKKNYKIALRAAKNYLKKIHKEHKELSYSQIAALRIKWVKQDKKYSEQQARLDNYIFALAATLLKKQE